MCEFRGDFAIFGAAETGMQADAECRGRRITRRRREFGRITLMTFENGGSAAERGGWMSISCAPRVDSRAFAAPDVESGARAHFSTRINRLFGEPGDLAA